MKEIVLKGIKHGTIQLGIYCICRLGRIVEVGYYTFTPLDFVISYFVAMFITLLIVIHEFKKGGK